MSFNTQNDLANYYQNKKIKIYVFERGQNLSFASSIFKDCNKKTAMLELQKKTEVVRDSI